MAMLSEKYMGGFSRYILAIALLLGQATWFASNNNFAAYDLGDVDSAATTLSSVDLDGVPLSDAIVVMAMLVLSVVIVRFEFYTRHIRVASAIGIDHRARSPPSIFPV